MRAPDLLESAAKVGASISCGDLEVSILVVVLVDTKPFCREMKEATDLELGRGYPGTSLEEL